MRASVKPRAGFEVLDISECSSLCGGVVINGLSCSAHTLAQPRAQSPTRQEARRSTRVRCRPRSTSVATPNNRSAVSARCTVRTDNRVSAARRSLVGRRVTPGAVICVGSAGLCDPHQGFQTDRVNRRRSPHTAVAVRRWHPTARAPADRYGPHPDEAAQQCNPDTGTQGCPHAVRTKIDHGTRVTLKP